jgi:hypothetical protein
MVIVRILVIDKNFLFHGLHFVVSSSSFSRYSKLKFELEVSTNLSIGTSQISRSPVSISDSMHYRSIQVMR